MSRRLTPAIWSCEFILIVAAAITPVRADVLHDGCPASLVQADPSVRGLELSRFDEAPEQCLKTIFMHCSAESENQVLGLGMAMMCSTVHEALLKRVFKGDFDTLLAWWRSQRGQSTDRSLKSSSDMSSTAQVL